MYMLRLFKKPAISSYQNNVVDTLLKIIGELNEEVLKRLSSSQQLDNHNMQTKTIILIKRKLTYHRITMGRRYYLRPQEEGTPN